MSQGIMEKNLPVAESIQSGDKIRIVTSAGNSKQVDASAVGGGGALKVTITSEEDGSNIVYSTDKTYNQIANAESLLFVGAFSDQFGSGYSTYELVQYGTGNGVYIVVLAPYGDDNTQIPLQASSADTILTYTKPR